MTHTTIATRVEHKGLFSNVVYPSLTDPNSEFQLVAKLDSQYVKSLLRRVDLDYSDYFQQ